MSRKVRIIRRPAEEYLIDSEGAVVVMYRNWLVKEAASTLYDVLSTNINWQSPVRNLYGRQITTPRGLMAYADNNVSSHPLYNVIPTVTWESEECGILAGEIRDRVVHDERITTLAGQELYYDSCLLNFYRDGQDTIAAHSDKEAMGPLNSVVALSIGASRKFEFKKKTKPAGQRLYDTVKTVVHSGDLMIMLGTTQELYTHTVPREPSVTDGRISITFRSIGQ